MFKKIKINPLNNYKKTKNPLLILQNQDKLTGK